MVLCYVERLLELTGSQCRSCPLQCTITTRVVGCALVMKMTCSAGHVFTWSSSPVIRNANWHVIYKANLMFASALLISGNNYYKIQQFFKFMHMNCISPSTFFTYQRLRICLVISDFYTRKLVRWCMLFTWLVYLVMSLGYCFATIWWGGSCSFWWWAL